MYSPFHQSRKNAGEGLLDEKTLPCSAFCQNNQTTRGVPVLAPCTHLRSLNVRAACTTLVISGISFLRARPGSTRSLVVHDSLSLVRSCSLSPTLAPNAGSESITGWHNTWSWKEFRSPVSLSFGPHRTSVHWSWIRRVSQHSDAFFSRPLNLQRSGNARDRSPVPTSLFVSIVALFLASTRCHTTFSECQPRLFCARFSLPLPRLLNRLSPSPPI